MKKKIIITVIIIINIAIVLASTNMFTREVFTGKLFRVDTVYEEIYNLVMSEKHGNATVLTASTDGSYVDYDLGIFSHICIFVNDEFYVSLSPYHNGEYLKIHIFSKKGIRDDEANYMYDHQNNTLYGNKDDSYLFEKFTLTYLSWIGDDGKFTPENQGNYTYVYDEFPLSVTN